MKEILSGDMIKTDITDYIEDGYTKYEAVLTNSKVRLVKKPNDKNIVMFTSEETKGLEKGIYELLVLKYIDEDNSKGFKIDTYKVLGGAYMSDIYDIDEKIAVINDLILGRAKEGYSSYTINGRTITKLSPTELMKLLEWCQKQRDVLINSKRKHLGKLHILKEVR